MELNQLSIVEAAQGLKEKKFSSRELTENCFRKIEEKEKDLLAFLEINKKEALAQAEIADQSLAKEKVFPLTGIPLAVKDNILVQGRPCTAASQILKNYLAPYDATVIRRLKEEKAVILGKTNLDEFAMGASTENSSFQITHNPYDLERVPGGSSGGSAAAVKGGEAIYSLGSDTGGSVRQPAAFCGLVGLRPTYGSVSRFGLIAFASSLDQIGPLTKTVADSRLVFQAIKGRDERDATSQKLEKEDSSFSFAKLRIGLFKDELLKEVDPRIIERIKKAVAVLEKEGVKIEVLDFPSLPYALPTYYIIAPAEASANLARYDGIRYGKSVAASNLEEVYRLTRGQGFGQEVKRRIILGTFVLSAGYADKYYKKAWKVREAISNDFLKAFQKVDVIISPTTPSLPFKIGEKTQDPIQMYASDLLTTPASLAGLPALSLPVGEIDQLPVGLQITGSAFQEELLFKLGEEIEKLTFPL
jgi:aspartyl-tRNA(Asn)/glutamyl-tRNA(Gln) amidotransferase subunit A